MGLIQRPVHVQIRRLEMNALIHRSRQRRNRIAECPDIGRNRVGQYMQECPVEIAVVRAVALACFDNCG